MKVTGIFLKGLCLLIAAATVILMIFSLAFTLFGEAPSFFGNRIYLVKTDQFTLAPKGAAVIAQKPGHDLIQPGNIVIYQNSEKRAGLAEIHTADIADDVYTFTAASDRGTSIILSQGQVIGRAVKISGGLGTLISFAMSPAGVFVLAILPSAGIIIYEISKSISLKIAAAKAVRPVKKQDEIPTFLPRQKNAAVINAYKGNEEQGEDYDMEEEVRRKNPAYNASDLMGVSEEKKDGFLRTSKKSDKVLPPPLIKTKPESATAKLPQPKKDPLPVSQKRLNEVIAQTNLRMGRTPPEAETTPIPAKREKPVETVVIPTGKSTPPSLSKERAMPIDKILTEELDDSRPYERTSSTKRPVSQSAATFRNSLADRVTENPLSQAMAKTAFQSPPQERTARQTSGRERITPPPAETATLDSARTARQTSGRERITPPPAETATLDSARTARQTSGRERITPPTVEKGRINSKPTDNPRTAPRRSPSDPLPPPISSEGRQNLRNPAPNSINLNRTPSVLQDKTAEIEKVKQPQAEKRRLFSRKPPPPPPPPPPVAASGAPRLESVLNDEGDKENIRYNIEDILNSFEKR